MKNHSLWTKIPVLALFFGSIAAFVAFRTGAFDKKIQAPMHAPGAVPDSPGVKSQPELMINSTKSGRIIESRQPSADTQKNRPFVISGTKSLLPMPKQEEKVNQGVQAEQKFIIPGTKSMDVSGSGPGASPVPDSAKKADTENKKTGNKPEKKKSRNKNNVNTSSSKDSNKNNDLYIIPSTKSDKVLPRK